MTDSETPKSTTDSEIVGSAGSPLVFISHDSRDAELAEAFGKLLKSVSSGMIKTFRSTDKRGKEGIDFGEEWYKRLMAMLQSTSDVVCLFTERSLDRPWILFEAGVAKGKLITPVIGVALGVPLSRISAGPFYQFHNMDSSEESLSKLVYQLGERVQNLELDDDVVKNKIKEFKKTEADILKRLSTSVGKKGVQEQTEDNPIVKLVEEMKSLPSRVADRLTETDEPYSKRRKIRKFHPVMMKEIMYNSGEANDPIGILLIACAIRDDAPWLYEILMDIYRAFDLDDPDIIQRKMENFRNLHNNININLGS